MPTFPRSPARRLRFAAYALLIVGWLAAIGVYLAALHGIGDVSANDVDTMEPTPHDLLQLERIGGKTAVRIMYFQRWFGSLWHGQRLAFTLAVLTTIVVLVGVHIADLIGEDEEG